METANGRSVCHAMLRECIVVGCVLCILVYIALNRDLVSHVKPVEPESSGWCDWNATCNIASSSCHNAPLLILVHSAIDHDQHRHLIRFYLKQLPWKWKALFVVGLSSREKINVQIQKESLENGDLLVGNFIDSYHNLTCKHVFAVSCAVQLCDSDQLVLKMDDDIFVNWYLLRVYIDKVIAHNTTPDSMFCYRMSSIPVMRDHSSKWFTSLHQYPQSHYPEFCSGWAYLVNVSMLRKLVGQVKYTSMFWIDDVYVTGMLRRNVSSNLVPYNHLVNVDIRNLFRWLHSHGQARWFKLFSNTENDLKLLYNSFHLNHLLHGKISTVDNQNFNKFIYP